jgi:hypothetical protein
MQDVTLKRWYLPRIPRVITTENIIINIIWQVRNNTDVAEQHHSVTQASQKCQEFLL